MDDSTSAPHWDALWIHARLATMRPGEVPYGAIDNGALGVSGGRLAFVGAMADLPAPPAALANEVYDADGRWVTPGLIDCHTHLVYGGDRAAEFEQRLLGTTYEEIARSGGGILSTVRATRAASEADLVATARRRLHDLTVEGVTTIEIKSGYGLDIETEMRMLRAARALGASEPVTVRTTFLGAHALPPEFAGRADEYIDHICEEMLPAVADAGLADAVDAFCESIAFTPDQVERVFRRARELDLPVKLHAEQLSNLGGAALAARYQALSADHLEYLDEEGVRAMAAAGTVAVLLPGAFYTLRETQVPPIDLFRQHGVAMAVATDSNPGSSPVTSLLLILNMACTLFRMTPEEALTGITRHAASALGLATDRGTLEVGRVADFVLWEIDRPADLTFHLGANPCRNVVRGGRILTAPDTQGTKE